jgi:nucleolar GTP-binding protein
VLVLNKADVTRLEDLPEDRRALVQEILDSEGVQGTQVSCYSEEGVMDLKNTACDALLAQRVETKLKGAKIATVLNRIHVAQPKARDDVVRAPFIPDSVKERKKYDKTDPERPRLARDIEAEEGGPGVYSINLKSASHARLVGGGKADMVRRGLLSQEGRVEGGRHTRDLGWQERRRFYRPRHRGKA